MTKLFRPKVLKALIHLLRLAADAADSEKLSREQQGQIMSAFWGLVRAYRG